MTNKDKWKCNNCHGIFEESEEDREKMTREQRSTCPLCKKIHNGFIDMEDEDK